MFKEQPWVFKTKTGTDRETIIVLGLLAFGFTLTKFASPRSAADGSDWTMIVLLTGGNFIMFAFLTPLIIYFRRPMTLSAILCVAGAIVTYYGASNSIETLIDWGLVGALSGLLSFLYFLIKPIAVAR